MNGFRNNYHYTVLNDCVPVNSDDTANLIVPQDFLSVLKTLQNYRNISRHVRKYFYGDKLMERSFLIGLKKFFRIPLTCQTPVHLIKTGWRKRFSDQFDREWELYSYNQHPFFLNQLKLGQEIMMKEKEEEEMKKKGEKTLEEQSNDFLFGRFVEESEKKGSKLSINELDSIFKESTSKYYEAMGYRKVRDDGGEFNDFLENRRPFINNKGNIETQ